MMPEGIVRAAAEDMRAERDARREWGLRRRLRWGAGADAVMSRNWQRGAAAWLPGGCVPVIHQAPNRWLMLSAVGQRPDVFRSRVTPSSPMGSRYRLAGDFAALGVELTTTSGPIPSPREKP